jgi:hypothetical protein
MESSQLTLEDLTIEFSPLGISVDDFKSELPLYLLEEFNLVLKGSYTGFFGGYLGRESNFKGEICRVENPLTSCEFFGDLKPRGGTIEGIRLSYAGHDPEEYSQDTTQLILDIKDAIQSYIKQRTK